MDDAQETLFGETPRRVGTPSQHWVWDAGQVGHFIDAINGRRNAYATLGWWDFESIEPADEGPGDRRRVPEVCDKVLYDLDSPAKASEREPGNWSIFDGSASSEPSDDEVIALMRQDADLAEKVLGKVCEDAQELADRSANDNVPVVGVFSGFGIHIHQLYEPRRWPSKAMATTAQRYIDRTGIDTADRAIIGQSERICRVPNCERVADSIRSGGNIVDGRSCGLYTVPLTVDELRRVTPEMLLDLSDSPRSIETPDAAERPEMRIWEDYETGYESDESVDLPPRPLNPEETDYGEDSDLRWLLEEILRMPCMVERLLDDPNPDHRIRVNAVVMMLNVGLTPREVYMIFRSIRWVDWDPETTKYQIKSIANGTYHDRSCSSLRDDGFCVRADEPTECPTYGWSGGTNLYR